MFSYRERSFIVSNDIQSGNVRCAPECHFNSYYFTARDIHIIQIVKQIIKLERIFFETIQYSYTILIKQYLLKI